jgi:hypothetical protein
MPSPENVEIMLPLHWNGKGNTPVTVHRSSWDDPMHTFIGVKAGSPSDNHGNMDIGSFVLDADGVRWAMDLGAEGYHGIESRGMNLWSSSQDSDRWKIFRQQNLSHNTLVIDGNLQHAAGSGKILGFSENPEFPFTLIDMSAVYPDQAETVHRGVALLPSREVLVQDELKGLKPGSIVRWGMITPGTPGQPGSSKMFLTREGRRLTLSILIPGTSNWSVIDTEKPRNEWDSPNPGTVMAAFEAEAPATGEIKLVVLLTPGSVTNSVAEEFRIRPLAEWFY